MLKLTVVCAAATAALAFAFPLQAHHSIGMFDVSTPIWIDGAVIHYELINPHAVIVLETTTENGRLQRWQVEGPPLPRLEQRGFGPDSLKVGDVIEVCGFALKTDPRALHQHADADGVPTRFVHGHVVVTPDGRVRLWGSYGKLDRCIASDDEQRESWLDLLNSDPLIHDFWCDQRRTAIQSTESSRAFVEQINSRLTDPCD